MVEQQPPMNPPQDQQPGIAETEETPSPIRRAVIRGLTDLGFAGLQMGLTGAALSTGNIFGALAVGKISDTAVDALRDIWFNYEYENVRDNELKEYNENLQAALEEYQYKITVVEGPDGKKGLPTGPPGPGGEPTGIVTADSPGFVAARQRAEVEMSQKVMELTMGLYDALQGFKENPYVRDAMHRILTTQAMHIESLTSEVGTQLQQRIIGEQRATEQFESEMMTAEAERGALAAGAAESRARAGLLRRQTAAVGEEGAGWALELGKEQEWIPMVERAMKSQIESMANRESVKEQAIEYVAMQELAGSMQTGLVKASEAKAKLGQLIDDVRADTETYGARIQRLQKNIAVNMALKMAPKKGGFEVTEDYIRNTPVLSEFALPKPVELTATGPAPTEEEELDPSVALYHVKRRLAQDRREGILSPKRRAGLVALKERLEAKEDTAPDVIDKVFGYIQEERKGFRDREAERFDKLERIGLETLEEKEKLEEARTPTIRK